MKRYKEIDILKGIAVLCMIIFHFFYFPNQYGFKEIEYDTVILKCIAKIAQIIFITCVGINLVFSNQKKDSKKKHYKRIVKLLCYALLMSIFTYFIFREKYVKFGILHFIAFSSFALFTFVDKPKRMKIITWVFILLLLLNKMIPELFYLIPQPFAFIGGFYNDRYSSVDHFPILPWIIVVCIGTFIGNYLVNNEVNTPKPLLDNKLSKLLEKTGQKSLEIYAVHWIVLYVIYCIIYDKYRFNM